MLVGNRSYQSYVAGLAELAGLEEAHEVALSQAARAGQDVYSAAVRKQQSLKEKWDEVEGRAATLVRRSEALARRLGNSGVQAGSPSPATPPARSLVDVENALREAASELAQGEESQAWVDRNAASALPTSVRRPAQAPAPVAAPMPQAPPIARGGEAGRFPVMPVILGILALLIVVLIVVLLFVSGVL